MLLNRLSSLAAPSKDKFNGPVEDSWADQPAEIRQGWRRVLTAIATTESYERLVLEPMVQAFHQKEAQEYLRKHAQDEVRHGRWLTQYLEGNFNYVKRSPTLSDRVFYEGLIPKMAFLFKRYPTSGIISLYAYEKFAIGLYEILLQDADRRGLTGIHSLMRAILRDEGKHVAGLETLLGVRKQMQKERWLSSLNLKKWEIESRSGSLCLFVVRNDLRFDDLGFHNRELCHHFGLLGIKQNIIDQLSQQAVAAARRLL